MFAIVGVGAVIHSNDRVFDGGTVILGDLAALIGR